MRKLYALFAAIAITIAAQATDYPYLVFTNTAGTTTIMSVDQLTITIHSTTLEVTDAQQTKTFTLTDLANMQFSIDGSTVTATENVLNAEQPIHVYSASGILIGAFPSLSKAVTALQTGAYVIKQGALTQTIHVQ